MVEPGTMISLAHLFSPISPIAISKTYFSKSVAISVSGIWPIPWIKYQNFRTLKRRGQVLGKIKFCHFIPTENFCYQSTFSGLWLINYRINQKKLQFFLLSGKKWESSMEDTGIVKIFQKSPFCCFWYLPLVPLVGDRYLSDAFGPMKKCCSSQSYNRLEVSATV